MTSDRWQQVERLYQAALEREGNQRTAFLIEACAGDDALRQELESLLAQEKGAGFLESPALEVAAQQFAAERGQDLIGRRIGFYQILLLLGSGGMGEVYRAKDTKLKREVALKVLPDAFASDPERMARFQREAEVLAALNHPNIAQIYGVEQRALVMELVPGKTLKGPLPIETALNYARQIADALEAAHDKGITHRDLKPSNIMVTPEGVVKVLDFGLAAQSRESEEGETLNTPPTRSGMIVGTAAYMSPEQARGEKVDKRADIWAFGAVLYEMFTGKQAFSGETASDTLAAVLKEEPEWNRVPQKTQRLLRRCLEKDPKRRLRDIADAMALIDDTPQGTASRHSRLPWAVATAAVLVAALAAAGWWYATRPAPLRPLVRLNAEIAADTPLARGGGMLALSPDGVRLVLRLQGADGTVRLYTRLLQQNQFAPLAGTENAFSPFFSPDGEWIGFFADGKLKKISVQGGAAVTLCDAPDPDGASWGDDGNIIAALAGGGYREGLWRVPSSGGTPVRLTKLNPGEFTHRWPHVLAGSQAVLFTASTQVGAFDGANIDVVSLKTGERKTVQQGGFFARYLPTSNGAGHLVYLHQSTLFAVPFDPRRLALGGAPAPILEDVGSGAGRGGDFDFGGGPSGPGTFVYLAEKGQGGPPISRLDRAGKIQPLNALPGVYTSPRFSPDGKRLAFSMTSSTGTDIWVKDLDRDTSSRLSFLAGVNRLPVWTPDGKNIVFQSTNSPAAGLYWIRSDGSGEAERLTDDEDDLPYSFSPGGKRLAFWKFGTGGNHGIFIGRVEGDAGRDSPGARLGKPELFLKNGVHPAFSPDGRWMAYTSEDSGTAEVYVRPFPGPGGRWQISKGGGGSPLWSRDGRELLFQGLGRVMAVDFKTTGDSFAPGKPQVWSEPRLLIVPGIPMYDLAPDGKYLAAILANDELPTHLTFLLNFFDELRRKAPPAK